MKSLDFSLRTAIGFMLFELPFAPVLIVALAQVMSLPVAALLGPAVVINLVRIAVSTWYIESLLRPINRWRDASDPQALLAANDTLQRSPIHLTLRQPWTWLGMLAISTAYIGLALAERAPIGAFEVETTAVLAIAIIAGSAAYTFSVLSVLIETERVAMSEALAGHGLRSRSTGGSLTTRLSLLMLAFVVAPASVLGAITWSHSAAFVRYQTVAELAASATSDAERIAEGLAPMHGEVVSTDELPAAGVLVDELPAIEHRVTLDRRAARASVAIPLTGGDQWLVHEGPVMAVSNAFALKLGVFCLLVLMWAPLTAVMLARALTAPLHRLERGMRSLVEVGDFLHVDHVPVVGDDEIASVTFWFNELTQSLRELTTATGAVAKGDLSARYERSGDLRKAFDEMLGGLHDMVVRIRETALGVASTASEIFAAAQAHERAADVSSESVREVNATVAYLAESADQVTVKATRVLEIADRSLTTNDAMVARITNLSGQAAGISDLVDSIREVADRSDLLALNGSLEATRAGEAGRGFALVAMEMRRLAERVTGTAVDVRSRVAEIRSAGSNTAVAMEESRKWASDTATAAREIFAVTQAQAQDTARVSEAIQQLADFVVAASVSSSQTRAATESLHLQAAELERLTLHFKLRLTKG